MTGRLPCGLHLVTAVNKRGMMCFYDHQPRFLLTMTMFLDDDFLLRSASACRLYHDYAADQPILDYHNHLSPAEIAADRQFANLYEIWLEGDHYKWRAMRANGCAEAYVSGDAKPREKYAAWAETVPHTLCNPLYHWTHLELRRYFGIEQLLGPGTADEIWDAAEQVLGGGDMSVQSILKKFKVTTLCTTDDPVDDLAHHDAIAASSLSTSVRPTFRPDGALRVDEPEEFNAWIDKLMEASGKDVSSLATFVDAIKSRHDYFHEHGCRLSDQDLRTCPRTVPTEADAAKIFDQARGGVAANEEQRDQFFGYMLVHFGRWDVERDWTKQMHIGVFRNNNEHVLRDAGRDMGYDSIGDYSQGRPLQSFLSHCEMNDALPRTILYNNNPVDNYLFATMAGNFPGKVQYGAAWWYLDQKDGIEAHLRDLGNVGLLSRFVGMLTDSRSFMSFPRHEYFRRVLCNFIGDAMEHGELPGDFDLVGDLVARICHQNAGEFLQLS